MPNRNERNPGNAPGAFYVDSTCIDCDLCRDTAPLSFQRNEEIGLSIVFRQPVSIAEIKQAREALEGCPTESIGCDGNEI
ncbi:MAG: putative ferredoxin [Verrucomicrobiales bacterium]|nr:putative ferredoxin [Verrucomicrobiales bacterium]